VALTLYASWTGTKRNLAALRREGWRLLMTPDTLIRCKGTTRPRWPDGDPAPYCLDNGAWGCHQRGEGFNAEAFVWALERIGTGADWVVAPDIVGAGLASLRLTEAWLPRIVHPKVLIAVQDGMSPEDVAPMLNSGRGIFLGGSTEYKLQSMPMWGRFARQAGVHFHVARVNTIRRLRACQSAGADSIDGSKPSRWSMEAGNLPSALKQTQLWGRS
jgi:hypothetical protein